jgi:hypothetical protein
MNVHCDHLAKRISAARVRLQTAVYPRSSGSSGSSGRRAVPNGARNLRCRPEPRQTLGLTRPQRLTRPQHDSIISDGANPRWRRWRRYHAHGCQVSWVA